MTKQRLSLQKVRTVEGGVGDCLLQVSLKGMAIDKRWFAITSVTFDS
jgi:hypothetical protein